MLNPLTHRKILKKGLPGTATIVEMGALDRGGTSFNLPITLQVLVEGITPYEVEDQWMVKAKDTVGLSGSIPVKVDREDHSKVAIDWEGVRAGYQAEKQARRDALASGGTAPPGQAVEIDLQGGDLRQAEQMLRQMGVDVNLEQQAAAAQAAAMGSLAGRQQAAGAEGDTLAQLERLAALRDSGALTEEEFAEQKRRILGG